MSIKVLSLRDPIPEGFTPINTTSKSLELWSKNLSPFLVGGHIKLYGRAYAHNVENAWQYSKVYEEFVDENGDPTPDYFKWAQAGFKKYSADRYPMGKGKKPLYSFWNGHQYDYIEARKKIYIPIYSRQVAKTPAFFTLKQFYKTTDIALIDFDGYDKDQLDMSYEQVVNYPNRTMGHAFVLAMLLEEFIQPGEVFNK